MSIAKLDLYNPEWLELVFEKRNHAYGAYDLRRHYAGNMVKAMAIAFFGVAFLYTGYSILFKVKPVTTYREIPDIIIQPIIETHPKIVVPPKSATVTPHVEVNKIKYPVMVATIDKEAENPPKSIELQTAAISTQTSKGKDGNADNISIDGLDGGTPSTMNTVTEDTKPRETYEIQVMPQPYGGEAGWMKFLQKNIHYPARASESNVQGKVILSFIVEKDGKLTNIAVERSMGSGLDEEAVRVLKLAPAWKPGIQNGHPVRVKFVIPISFQLADPE